LGQEAGVIAALFDSDGTLFANQLGRGMMRYAELNGRGRTARKYFVSLLPAFYLRRVGLIKPERFQNVLIGGLGRLIQGMDAAEGAAMFDWVAHEFLLASEREDAARRLQEHQAKGHRVLIVSGMFSPCLELIGKHFGVSDLIGTGLEIQDGRYTGRIIPPVITGAFKADRARGFFAERGLDVDWPASYAYGDSYTDREMLELAGHPVAVHPDAKLNALALAQGWELLGPPK
jgi:HAD superfamily hydrolase (TIGR01490 family)